MNTIYTLEQLRHIEQIAEEAGIDLMDRAARSTADWVCQNFQPSNHILVACGTGNNGGDALWAALNLHARNFRVTLFIPEQIKSPAALRALKLCRDNSLPEIKQLTDLSLKPNLLIDGLFGIGLNRLLSEPWQQVINSLNTLTIPTLALDTPSGLDAYTGATYGTAIKATTTLTFLGAKPALNSSKGLKLAGKVIVDALDLPKSMAPVLSS